MLLYRHYKLHLRFNIVWLVTKKCILEIGWAEFVDTLLNIRIAVMI